LRIGPTEEARLLVFQAAELARRTRAQGLRLNAPEAIAIACDDMHMAARAGGTIQQVLQAGRASVSPEDLLDGVAELIKEIRLEVVLEEGTRLVVLRELGTSPDGTDSTAVTTASGEVILNEGLEALELEVLNTSDHEVRVSSHFPFERTNPRLSFDREAAAGTRLDIPAGDTVRWGPGERRAVRVVRMTKGGD